MNVVDIIKNFIKTQFNKKPLLQAYQIDEYAKKAEAIDNISLIKQIYNKCSKRIRSRNKKILMMYILQNYKPKYLMSN